MRRLYEARVGDIGFSRNGWLAYRRGEKPLHCFAPGVEKVATEPHHIEVPYRAGGDRVRRKLVMFYRAKP